MLKVTVYKDNKLVNEKEFQESETITVGRLSHNSIILDDKGVSREHCKFFFDSGNWKLIDLKSTSGTKLGDSYIESVVINKDGVIYINDFMIRVSIEKQEVGTEIGDNSNASDDDGERTVVYTQKKFGPAVQNRVEIIEGEPGGEIHYFETSVLIGRESDCDLSIDNDDHVSRKHAYIEKKGKKFYVHNLEKRNVTYINNKKILTKTLIKSNDIIKVGGTKVKVALEDTGKKQKKGDIAFSRPILISVVLLFVFIGFTALVANMMSGHSDIETIEYIQKKQSEINKLKRLISQSEEDAEKLIEKDKIEQALSKYKNIVQYSEELESVSQELLTMKEVENKDPFSDARLFAVKARDGANENIAVCKNQLSEKKRLQEIENKRKQRLFEEHKHRALDLYENQRFDEALLELEKAGKINNQDEEIKNLVKEITDAREKEKARNEARAESLRKIERMYNGAKANYQKGRLNDALIKLEEIADLNIRSEITLNVRKLIPEIKKTLMQRVDSDYKKGIEFYNKGELDKAIPYLKKVVSEYKNYKNAGQVLTNIKNDLEKQAKIAFEEGLVYEGINKIDVARRKWKQVLKIMPFTDNEYYRRAKQKLAEYQ